jgi:fucose permease
MQFVATPIVHHYGYRKILMWNALLTGTSIFIYAGFRADTPNWIIIFILLTSGFFRSLQFMTIDTLAYADLTAEQLSRANTFAAMAQQLSVSVGVGVAAFTLHISLMLRDTHFLTLQDIVPGFIITALLYAGSFFGFRRLDVNAGHRLNAR